MHHLTEPSAYDRTRAVIEASSSLSEAAVALGVSYRTLCRWRRSYPGLVPPGIPGRRPSALRQASSQSLASPAVVAHHKPRQKRKVPRNHDSRVAVTDGKPR